MDALFGGGGGAGDAALGQFPLEQWFFEMPVCTRWWTTATILTGVLVQCHIITPFQLFYSFRAVFHKSQVGQDLWIDIIERGAQKQGADIGSQQYWRLLTTFIYFGPLSFNLIFHIFFIQRYARMLEESAVSPAHFSWMMGYAATTLLCLAPFFHQAFLGTTLSSTLVYIWSRRHPDTMLSFLGMFTFRAPWLPFVMIGLSVVFHGHWPKDELFGIAVGHGKLHHVQGIE